MIYKELSFRETMEAARQHNINVIKLEVAYELDCLAEARDPEIKLTEQQFEQACYLIERAYLKSEYLTVNNITQALLNMLEDTPLEEIDDVWDIIQKASYYY
jgi:hypothetical protein